MEKEFINDVIDKILNSPIVEQAEIPDIDLYMDQVTTLVEDKLGTTKRNAQDKLLTKTMVNNYTKAGLIPAPVKKKYSKEHLLRLIMIYHLKSVLSINDINTTFLNINNDKEIYDKFVNIQNCELKQLAKSREEVINTLIKNAKDDKEACVLSILFLGLAANYYKEMAEEIIDKYLTEADNK